LHCKSAAIDIPSYDFDIEYVKSEQFGQADALSRLIQEAKADTIDAELEEVVTSLQKVETELQQLVQDS